MDNLTCDDVASPNLTFLPLLLLPAAAVFGNGLVIAAVASHKALRTTTNFLIVSLAAADLLVGVSVMPFSIYALIHSDKWCIADELCVLYIVADVSCSTCSIANLVAISIDRFYAVVRHLEYRTPAHKRRTLVIIAGAWLFSFGIGLPQGITLTQRPSLTHNKTCMIESSLFMLYGSIFAFYLPCTVMIIMYGFVFYKLHRQQKLANRAKTSQATNQGYIAHDNLSKILTSAHGTENNVRNSFFCVAAATVRSPVSDTDSMESESCIDSDMTPDETSYKVSLRSWPMSSSASHATASAKNSNDPVNRKISHNVSNQLMTVKQRAKTVVRKIKDKKGRSVKKEARATRLVASVMVVFLICWSPFFAVNLIVCAAIRRDRIPSETLLKVFTACTYLGYLNSTVNPVIYALANNRFKAAFTRILCRCNKKAQKRSSRKSRPRGDRSLR